MPKRRFRPVRRRRQPSPWVWAGFAASAALGALTATLVAGSDDQPNPAASTQPTTAQLSDEVRRMITSYLDEEGYALPEEPDAAEPDPGWPAQPPDPIEPPVPVAPAVVPASRPLPAAKTVRPGAGPWPFAVVPEVVLPRVEAAIGTATSGLPPAVRPEEVPVGLWQSLNAPDSRRPALEQAEPRWTPEPAPPAAADDPGAAMALFAPEETPVEPRAVEVGLASVPGGPAEPVVSLSPAFASVEPLTASDEPESGTAPVASAETPVEPRAAEEVELASVSAGPAEPIESPAPAEPVGAVPPSGEPVGRGASEPAKPAVRADRATKSAAPAPRREPVLSSSEAVAPVARAGRGGKSVEPVEHDRPGGARETGERVAGAADTSNLPAGER